MEAPDTFKDFAQGFVFESEPVLGRVVRLEDSWRAVLSRSQPHQSARELLGQALVAAALLIADRKSSSSLGVQIQSSGSLRLLQAQCSNTGFLRGLVRSDGAIHPSDLEGALLAVQLEAGKGGSTYQGIVEMGSGGIGPALEAYFRQSEQLATFLRLFADEHRCGGLLLQRVPGRLTDEDAWNRLTTLASSITAEEVLNLGSGAIVRRLFGEEDVRLFQPSRLEFRCRCSKPRVRNVLKALGRDDIMSLLEERGQIEVDCEHCGKGYVFDAVDTVALFRGVRAGGSGTPELH
ncbi:Hsp33 family molecular chaperone HslO [Elongatibacter sediminis]|uniref:Hsp33 family molecular chaperone HslO n=1 Tax=Elongatibacter sediminis TaxID=3119006 RepID=A0AAW9RJ50_9GAMM